MAERGALLRLARRLGILDGYRDLAGVERETSDASRERLAAALGHPAGTEEEAERALARLDAAERERLVRPLSIVRRGRESAAALEVALPEPRGGAARFALRIAREDGREERVEGRAELAEGRARLVLRELAELPDGAHELELELELEHDVEAGGAARAARQRRIVAPQTARSVAEALGDERVFGVLANLYTLRRPGGLGRGDLRDLDGLVALAVSHGARFVGLNPVHAQRQTHAAASPYAPVSRLFRDPGYLDVEAVPELERAPAVRARLASDELRAELERAHAEPLVDHARHRRLHDELCTALHRAFREHARPERRRAYERFCAEQGELLDAFATFLAIDRALATPHGPLPRAQWPSELRRREDPAVARFAAEHAESVDYYRWLQFELDRQLGDVAVRARARGLDVGLYQDLAVAAEREGADGWLFEGLAVEDVSLGAPPDAYSRAGQDWGFAPWNPLRLAEGGAELWTCVLRAAFRHAGALRIDHALGLARQFWIPRGAHASEGAYVRFPADELMAIAALESRRAGALVIAEDLGTVPEGFRPRIESEAWLRSSVVYFERDDEGEFLPARAYPELSLATAATHDHVPLAGWPSGRDVELRFAAGELDEEERRAGHAARDDDVRALVRRLVAEGLLAAGERPDEPRLRVAVHAFLARTPARLVGVALDDLAGERDPVNLPGIGEERHPSWRRRMRRTLAEIADDPIARACLEALAERGGRQ